MSENPTNGELRSLLEELKAVADDTQKVFGGLTPAQLNWKPSAEQWSVGQCFEHLIRTNRGLLPALEQSARGEHRQTLWQRISPLSGLFGLYVTFAGNYTKTYGTLASGIILLLWLNYSAFSLLFGAELNSELDRQADIRAAGGENAGLITPARRGS